MIGIKINGTFLDLDPDTTIPYDINSDILNFEEVGGTVSFPFYFSNTPTNEQTFNHSRIVAVKNNKRYYEAEIFFKGHKIYDAEFELESAGGRYEGRFLIDAAIHYRDKDKLISDIITKEITLPGTAASDLNGYTDEENDMVFPMIHFQDYFDGQNDGYLEIFNNYNNTYLSTQSRIGAPSFVYYASGFLPCFKLLYVLKLLVAEWGYSLVDTASKSSVDLRKLILFNNVQIDENYKTFVNSGSGSSGTNAQLPDVVKVYEHLPKISVSKFFKIIKSFGINITFDSARKICRISLLKDIINDTRYVDWSSKAIPGNKVKISGFKGLNFSFADPKDGKQEELAGGKIDATVGDDVDLYSQLPLFSVANINEIRFVKEFNVYYIFTEWENPPAGGPYYRWELYKDAFDPLQIGEGDEKLEAGWAPVRDSQELLYKMEGESLVNDGAGVIQITGTDGLMDAFRAGIDLISMTYPTMQNREFAYIKSFIGANQFSAHITYVMDRTNVRFIAKKTIIFKLPDIDIAGNYKKGFSGIVDGTYGGNEAFNMSVQNDKFTPRLLFYHGLVLKRLGTETYPMATCSGWDNRGNRLTDFSLRWAGDDGLYKYFWEDIINFQKNLKEVEQPVVLDLGDIINFDRFRKVMIDNNKYLVKRIKAELTMQGIAVSQVEMYNV